MLITNGTTPRIPVLMVDATDDETAETGLTPTVQISKNGGSFAATTNAAVEVANGWYYVALTATETNTDGPLFVRATGTGADEWRDYHQVMTVVPANVTQYGGSAGTFAGGRAEVNTTHIAGSSVSTSSAQLGVNVVQVSGDSAAADNLEAALDGTGGVTITAALTGNVTGNLSGSVGSVTGNVGGNVTGSVGSIASGGLTAASIGADAFTAAKFAADVTTEFQAGLATAAALTTIDDFLDTEITAIKGVTDKLDTALELDGAVYRYTTNALEQAPGGLTVQAIVDGVWDETLTAHLDSGSTGAALNAAGSAGDPWSTALPGAYGAGTAGKIIGDNINATVGSRATQASVDAIDGIVDSILVDTNELQTDWADGGRLDLILDARASQASVTTVDDFLDTEVAAILAAVDTEVGAIKAKTDNLPAAPAAVGDIPTAAQNADALLDRANGVETGLTPRQALRLALAALAGEISGGATTTITIRNAVADSKDRIIATVDVDGNRSAITYDLT